MIEKAGRKAFSGLLEKIAKPLSSFGLTPNAATIISLACSLLAAYFISLGKFKYAIPLFLLSLLFDALDGAIARVSGKGSIFGALLDSTFDKAGEIAVLMSFYFFDSRLALPIMLGISGMMLSSYISKHIAAVKKGENAKRPFSYIHTLASKAERSVIIVLAMIFPFQAVTLFYIYSALAGISALHRLAGGKKALEQ